MRSLIKTEDWHYTQMTIALVKLVVHLIVSLVVMSDRDLLKSFTFL